MTYAARVQSLHKEYFLKGETVRALRGVTFDIPEGDYVAIMGPSGSGKSTLLNVLGCLDRPTRGSLHLGESDVSQMDDNALSTMRASNIGFVFQSYNLIQQLTVLENIDRLKHRPYQLSGGQQQRVAIARSLINDPYFILADEPTGNLDSQTTDEILALFQELHQQGKTIILVTHEDEVAAHTKRIIRLYDGEIAVDTAVDGTSDDLLI